MQAAEITLYCKLETGKNGQLIYTVLRSKRGKMANCEMCIRISHHKKTSSHLEYIVKEIILNIKEEQVRCNICYTMLHCYGQRKVFN